MILSSQKPFGKNISWVRARKASVLGTWIDMTTDALIRQGYFASGKLNFRTSSGTACHKYYFFIESNNQIGSPREIRNKLSIITRQCRTCLGDIFIFRRCGNLQTTN